MGVAIFADAAPCHPELGAEQDALSPFYCAHCNRALGHSDEHILVMGEAGFDQAVTIAHLSPACGKLTLFRPGKPPLAIEGSIAARNSRTVAFHCEHCHKTLGFTDEHALLMGEAGFHQTITITHRYPSCGRKTVWRPRPARKN